MVSKYNFCSCVTRIGGGKKIFFWIILTSLIFLYSYILTYNINDGYSFRQQLFYAFKQGFIANFLTALFFYRISKPLFNIYFGILSLLSACYTPYMLMYGYDVIIAIANILNTNPNESLEFLRIIPLRIYIFVLVEILLSIFLNIYVYRIGSKNNSSDCKESKIRKHIVNGIIFVMTFFITVQGIWIGYRTKWANPLSYSKSSVIYFLGSYLECRKGLELFEKIKYPSTWTIESVSPRYKNYIVIIGESLSKDYMHLYGYPISPSNTPFLDTINAKISTNYHNFAPYTMSSLTSFFVLDGHLKPVYNNNIVSLANKSGFKTYWISNQEGSVGRSGSFSPCLGSVANVSYFLNKKGEDFVTKIKDSELLPVFKNYYVNNKSDSVRIFFIHTMGSHTSFDSRLEEPLHINRYNRNVSEYLQTIEQTDSFIHKIYDIVRKEGDSFSIVYFSDHGLSPSEDNALLHGSKSSSFDIPFIQISHDDSSRILNDTPRSSNSFLEGFANWTGINCKELKSNKDFISAPADTVNISIFGKIIPYNEVERAKILGK